MGGGRGGAWVVGRVGEGKVVGRGLGGGEGRGRWAGEGGAWVVGRGRWAGLGEGGEGKVGGA